MSAPSVQERGSRSHTVVDISKTLVHGGWLLVYVFGAVVINLQLNLLTRQTYQSYGWCLHCCTPCPRIHAIVVLRLFGAISDGTLLACVAKQL